MGFFIAVFSSFWYNSGMKNTEKSAEQWQEIVSEKDKEIAELRKQVDWFKGQSKQFGPSSEKSAELEEQISLFNEPETLADPKAEEPDLERERILSKSKWLHTLSFGKYTRGKSRQGNGIWISPMGSFPAAG